MSGPRKLLAIARMYIHMRRCCSYPGITQLYLLRCSIARVKNDPHWAVTDITVKRLNARGDWKPS